MKYQDENGEFKDIIVKASDTLPIGAIVDYDGDTIPYGWELISDEDTYKKIKKIRQTAAVVSQTVNERSTGYHKVYDVDYINEQLDTINAKNDYSEEEEEHVIGTWMGKPLYRKTFAKSGLGMGTTKITNLGFTPEIVIKQEAFLQASSDVKLWYQLPLVGYNGNTSDKMYVYVSDGDIYVYSSGNWSSSSWTLYITLEYTKTTDEVI